MNDKTEQKNRRERINRKPHRNNTAEKMHGDHPEGRPGREKDAYDAITEETTSANSRKKAFCPYAVKCGGCDYQGISYEEQLQKKQAYIHKMLKPFGPVKPITGMEDPLHYRHKVHAVFGCTRQGRIVAGSYRKNTHDIVDIEGCRIEDEEADAIILDVKNLLRSFRIKTYDEDTGYGLLRHVLVRKGYDTGQIMVVLVLSSPVLPSKNNFAAALRKKHPAISTIVINVNDKRTSMVLGDRNIPVYGPGYIEDQLCGMTFRISPTSFYQVNPRMTELLYRQAMEEAALTGRERVIDAYCGTGTIGLIASGKAREVLGVELNREAVRDAITNAKRNHADNIRFINQDAGEYMMQLAAAGQSADVVIMDPPRTGSTEEFLKALTVMGPGRIVYVSCGPDTLARDLKYLTAHGYRMKEAVPFDCFPYTLHIETVVRLEKQ